MEAIEIIAQLPSALLGWYDEHRRDLPWRQDRDPYHIWISEIMLQQTRVEAVKGYYSRFLQALPTVEDLAKAHDDHLHKLWEGLGYYSRVRNLKKAAQRIMELHSGCFPREYAQVRALPGIGPYTAGAICSIAFDQKTPAVDGNVLRLVSRLTDDATPIDLPAYKKQVEDALRDVYPERAGDFTQALMELGATLCGPNREPDCGGCPCRLFCLGCHNGTCADLPVKLPKKQRRLEEMTVLILQCEGKIALQKRPNKGLLAGLWQFPNVPGKLDVSTVISKMEENGLKVKQIIAQVERDHVFTHVKWDMCGIYMEVAEEVQGLIWFTPEEIELQAALPTAFRQFFREVHHV
jgi:A/G-specific adenine glycosylase